MIPATSETPDYGYTRGTRSGQNRLKQTQIAEIPDRKETKIRVKTPKRKSLKWSGSETVPHHLRRRGETGFCKCTRLSEDLRIKGVEWGLAGLYSAFLSG